MRSPDYHKNYRSENAAKIDDRVKRWVENNPERRREIAREYYHRNKEKVKQSNLRWRNNNKEKVLEKQKQWAENNKDKISAKRRTYRQENKDRIKVANEDYRKRNLPLYAAAAAKRRGQRRKATPAWLTAEQYDHILMLYEDAQRITKESGIPHEVDHIIPLQGKLVCGLHVPWNLQVIPVVENRQKSNRLKQQENGSWIH